MQAAQRAAAVGLARGARSDTIAVVVRRKEDKQLIVAALEEQESFWQDAQEHAPGRFTRLLARGMRRWASSGVSEFRRRIAEETPAGYAPQQDEGPHRAE